jgi:hypothetical protein
VTARDEVTLHEVRRLVREALSELLPPGGRTPPFGPERVAIHSDADLNAFAARVGQLAADPEVREALIQGRHRFALESAPKPSAASEPEGRRTRVETGVVTERKVAAIAKYADQITVAAGVRFTPSALDRAKDLGIRIERET